MSNSPLVGHIDPVLAVALAVPDIRGQAGVADDEGVHLGVGQGIDVGDAESGVRPRGLISMTGVIGDAAPGVDVGGDVRGPSPQSSVDLGAGIPVGGHIIADDPVVGAFADGVIVQRGHEDGVVEPAGRTRSRVKAIDSLYKFVGSYSHIEELAVEGANCPDDVDNLVKRLGAIFPQERIYRSRTTPVIGTHTGPGLILVAVLGDK